MSPSRPSAAAPSFPDELRYKIGDRVEILDLRRPGVLNAIMLDRAGLQFHVVYWDKGDQKTAWLYEWEFQLRETKKRPGHAGFKGGVGCEAHQEP